MLMPQEGDLRLVHGLLLWHFIDDVLVAFGLVDLRDYLKTDLVVLLGVGLPVLQGTAVFGFDYLVEGLAVHVVGNFYSVRGYYNE